MQKYKNISLYSRLFKSPNTSFDIKIETIVDINIETYLK